MKKIPEELRNELSADPYYKRCCITGSPNDIEWHHNLIFGGSQVNERFCILPLTYLVHKNIERYKEKCDWIMLNRATDAQLQKYSKAINYVRKKEILNEKYGIYKE